MGLNLSSGYCIHYENRYSHLQQYAENTGRLAVLNQVEIHIPVANLSFVNIQAHIGTRGHLDWGVGSEMVLDVLWVCKLVTGERFT